MSTIKMGFKNLFVFTALLLLWKVCKVYGQAARVEYINQPCCSSLATTVQATPQLVVPAIFAPTVSPYDSYIQESVPTVPSYNGFNGYSNFAPSYPQPMPPIIIEDGDNNNLQQLMYFLLFAMKNRRNGGYGNCGGCSGGCNCCCGCGGGCNGGCGGKCGGNCGSNYGGNCGGSCGGSCGGNCCCNCGGNCCCNCGCNCCCNCGGNCCGCSFIPYPIPYPINGACPYSFPGYGGYPDNFCGCLEDTSQQGQGSNDITVYIKTDSGCSC